jgi:inositol phosphorylceramide mannosyltransferase catalytic subunit
MLNRAPAVPAIPTLPEQLALPKLIHQTFPTKTLPKELQANVDALKARNPDWLYTLYDDNDIAHFIRDVYGDAVYERFERIEPVYGAARADLFRYLLLYKLGGVYLDIKSTATRPLDEVLRTEDRFIIAQWQNGPGEKYEFAGFHEEMERIHGGEFQQWFLVATAGHPFLKAVIENVLRNVTVYHPALHGVGKPGVLRVTGPIAYTLAIAPILDHHPHRRADAERDLGIEYTIYPTIVKDERQRQHLRLFRTHYSQAKTSLIRLTGVRKAMTRPLLAAEKIARSVRAVARRITQAP